MLKAPLSQLRTEHGLRVRVGAGGRETEVADADLAGAAVDKHVVALEVAVNDAARREREHQVSASRLIYRARSRWIVRVQIIQTIQNHATPPAIRKA